MRRMQLYGVLIDLDVTIENQEPAPLLVVHSRTTGYVLLSLHISPPHYLKAQPCKFQTPAVFSRLDPGNKSNRPKRERRDIGVWERKIGGNELVRASSPSRHGLFTVYFVCAPSIYISGVYTGYGVGCTVGQLRWCYSMFVLSCLCAREMV